MISLELFLISLVLFVVGVCLGSFTNVIIDRLPSKKFFSKNRSYCESCHKTLAWFDLIPIVSFLSLKARCRYCNHKISWRLIGVEIMTGVACVILGFFVSFNPLLFLLFALILILFIAIFFIDFKHRIIPDILLFFLIGAITVVHTVTGENIVYPLLSGIGGLVFFFILFVITKGRGIGFGDVKFAGVIGYMLGYPETVVALYSAFLTGAAVSVILVVVGKKKFKGGSIAFGPFLIAGVLIALLWTNEILALLF